MVGVGGMGWGVVVCLFGVVVVLCLKILRELKAYS